MKSTHLFILFFLFCTISCSNPDGKDYSYPPAQYLQLGMPDFDRPWKESEFGDIVGTLSYIKKREPLSLPRKDSRKSGQLFEHMISMDNLSFLNLDTLPLYEKAYRIQSFVRIQSKYIDIYTDLNNRQQYYNEELIDFYIYGISITQKMLDLAYQINESDKPGDIGLQSGFKAIQFGHVIMLASVLDKQKDTSLYNAKDLERLSDSIAHSVKRNRSWFDSNAVEKITQNMLVVVDSSSSDKIRNEYLDIINSL